MLLFTTLFVTLAAAAKTSDVGALYTTPTLHGKIIIPNSSAYHRVFNPALVTTKTGALLVFAEARRFGKDQDHIDLVVHGHDHDHEIINNML